ncbi:YceI family protein [Corallococcus exiguus]|uniref:Protein yceI n=1 Tax=Corallococcus exiguus TaxID=83462 RepID=A0A7Y1S2T8_9BACT|nr:MULTISPECIES: YceI family protein [Corallococcus]NBC40884.1 protein yceI precursor [Corallococcus exiguus]NNC17046.1 YceI family protein [Corallococcus exiguus]NRD67615.1 YceI family protein [Corallococcus exiguus]RKH15147.1 polyisoprenoid-binding protein [Corallococcus sp. CA041A]RKI08830.1 polyisoprenoid-binding protein [Corallococcus sp. AB030]
MKMSLKSVITLVAVAAPSFAFASAWEIDSSHSSAQFAVKHMMVSNVRGTFSNVKGNVNLDDKDITKSTIEATLDATTINTNEPKRDEHLKSPDFFDTAKFPTITFKSTKVAKAGKDKLNVTGDLTMHGVTKPVTLAVEGPTAETKDAWGNVRRGAVATTKIKRSDFGLTWNKALEAGGVAVGDEVTITLDLETTKKPDAAAAPTATDKK